MPARAPHGSVERQLRRVTPVAAPLEQRDGIIELGRFLDSAAHQSMPRAPVCKLVGPSGEVVIPESIFHVLERAAEAMARGDSISIVSVGQEMTTQQAANLLNVSRQYLVRLLDEGRIPCTKIGRHRRLRIEDVLAFKDQRDAHRKTGLDELTRMSEEFGGYEELP